MMTARKAILGMFAAMVALAMAPAARAADTALTGQELYARCIGTKEMLNSDRLYCRGYLEGMEDLTAARKLGLFCPPAGGVTDEDMRQAYMAWAKANPSALGGPASAAALAALESAYPCK